ncbi:MAG: GtrA family protein [Acidobacteria bacterium]|nr:GtrA family protein [Acidobacteriota bacterium]MBI3470401.1 GtrA family protein [Candidatus Solibacter usitatus]
MLGIGVQLGVLELLRGVLDVNYLVATALAVEAAVLHNFIWHERWTWRGQPRQGRAGRLVRFHVSNGIVSIGGNLILMRALAGWLGIHYLLANGITIAILSVVNFLMADRLVFRPQDPPRRGL